MKGRGTEGRKSRTGMRERKRGWSIYGKDKERRKERKRRSNSGKK